MTTANIRVKRYYPSKSVDNDRAAQTCQEHLEDWFGGIAQDLVMP